MDSCTHQGKCYRRVISYQCVLFSNNNRIYLLSLLPLRTVCGWACCCKFVPLQFYVKASKPSQPVNQFIKAFELFWTQFPCRSLLGKTPCLRKWYIIHFFFCVFPLRWPHSLSSFTVLKLRLHCLFLPGNSLWSTEGPHHLHHTVWSSFLC